MADDQNQRPYRGNDASQRMAPGSAPASANDPLAELARLIGQNDPFAEFGRDGNRRAAPPRQPEPVQSWQPEPAHLAPPALLQPKTPLYGSPDFPRAAFGSAPLAGGSDLYHVEGQTAGYQPAAPAAPAYDVPEYEVPGYGAPGYEASGFPVAPAGTAYEQDPFPPNGAQHGLPEDDYYDDVPPNRRRIGILAIAGVFALAVIGTAGAFGYRAIFGSSSVSSPPPVIKAEQAPSKIVPAAASKDAQASKMITERVNERGQGEQLVSREEQPVVVTTSTPGQAGAPQLGSGVVGSEPKRIRTIPIKPDNPADAGMPAPAETVPAPTAQPRVVSTSPQRAAPAPAPAPAPVATPMRIATPAPAVAVAEPARAAPAANAPLSLNPNAAPQAPARSAAPAPQRAAVAPPPAANGTGGGYAVQVSAQRSEQEAQAAFQSLQSKFPAQLGNRQPFIKRVDLGDKGIFFRAMVGPFASSGEAGQMCTSLKSAGGSCLVQKN